MFDGLALSSLFDNEGAPPDIDLPHERLELLTGSSSFSLHFAPELPCEFPSSVTLTVLLECPSPSANAFVVAPFGPWTEPKPDTFFPAGKATLSPPPRAQICRRNGLKGHHHGFSGRLCDQGEVRVDFSQGSGGRAGTQVRVDPVSTMSSSACAQRRSAEDIRTFATTIPTTSRRIGSIISAVDTRTSPAAFGLSRRIRGVLNGSSTMAPPWPTGKRASL